MEGETRTPFSESPLGLLVSKKPIVSSEEVSAFPKFEVHKGVENDEIRGEADEIPPALSATSSWATEVAFLLAGRLSVVIKPVLSEEIDRLRLFSAVFMIPGLDIKERSVAAEAVCIFP